jgi:hypothetical protein
VQVAAVVAWVVLFCIASELGTRGLDDGPRPQVLATLLVFFQIDQVHRGDPFWSYVGLAASIPLLLAVPLTIWGFVSRARRG